MRSMLLGLVCGAMGGALVGCGNNSPCDTKAVERGALLGTLDNDTWSSSQVSWEGTGVGINIFGGSSSGHRVTVRLYETLDGTPVSQAREAHDYPIEVDLDGQKAGTIVFDHSTGNTMLGQAGGWARIDRISSGELKGCFGATVSDQFDTIDLEADLNAELSSL